ncbi:PaaI family thioesterase [Arenibacterium halophilum]|uniref:PaaI family thioesterase n=1 Tax=Arenibacterium halophilum TaxID=2583821 RepID=A0ABY2XCX0_9RHOB|nr:PaaI family thioesterase [Arenibacterium halophilum]TMV14859.1 PaaI family thioesterase [Arenibacterium halophilum]
MTPAQLQDILDQNFAEWVRALDMRVISANPDLTVVDMQNGPALRRVGGIVSGQALAALADTAMVLAAIANAGEMRLFATTDLHTQFLRPGVAPVIRCNARIIRAGKALVFVRADMTDGEDGKPVATAMASFYAT